MRLDKNSYYSVVQFSARPSSFEFVNVGVVIAQPNTRQINIEMSRDAFPVKRMFGDFDAREFKLMSQSFRMRLQAEFEAVPSMSGLEAFAQSRANLFRLLPFQPILVQNSNLDIQRLFEELVAVAPHKEKREAPVKRLADLFKQQGVLSFVDNHPEPVILPGLEQPLRADFGYQNGHYNLIDAEQIKPKFELAAISRMAGKAQLLSQFSDKRLIVVAELPYSHEGLYDLIVDSLDRAKGRFFPFADASGLVADIRSQAQVHSL